MPATRGVYILDNDSSYPPLLEYYQRMRKDIQVIPLGANIGHTALWSMKLPQRLKVNGPFVYTDPDIVPIAECPPHVLDFFLEVLRAFPTKTKVGFGLRIDDLPEHYKFKRKVIAWESQFWGKKITPKLYDAAIDTTFALYRPNSGYDLSGIRSGFPYLRATPRGTRISTNHRWITPTTSSTPNREPTTGAPTNCRTGSIG